MLGTLNGVLEARGLKIAPDALTAEVEGINEIRDRLPVLTRIRIHYRIEIPTGARETVDRALERHRDKCPTAASLAGSVEVEWTADVREVDAG